MGKGELSLWSYVFIAFGLIYLVWSIDVVPDIPPVGFIDDAIVNAITVMLARKTRKET